MSIDFKGYMHRMKNYWRSFWWVMSDRCQYCGGETWQWSTDRAYCKKCGKRN